MLQFMQPDTFPSGNLHVDRLLALVSPDDLMVLIALKYAKYNVALWSVYKFLVFDFYEIFINLSGIWDPQTADT